MILVVGGNGFVGKYICRKLIDLGYEVVSLSRKQYDTSGYVSVKGDITEKEVIYDVVKKYNIQSIVHMSSLLNTRSCEDLGSAVRVNIVGSLNLLELCDSLKIKRFIYGSSYNAIGKPFSSSKEKVNENTQSLPEEFYGETKRFVEVLGNTLAKKGRFEFVSARMPIVVGIGAYSPTSKWRSEIFTEINKPGRITINFSKKEVLPLGHVEDIANEIILLVANKNIQHSIYNLPSESILVLDLVKTLNKANAKLIVECGDKKLKGMPPHVSWERFKTEFNYKPLPILYRITNKTP